MPKWLPVNASSFAGDIDDLILLITLIVGAWLILAEACLIFFALRFRRKAGAKAAYLPGDTWKSMAWILVPVLAVLACDFVIDAASAPVWEGIKEHSPRPGAVVRITGRQWVWQFTYPGPDGAFDTADDIQTAGDLHVPANTVVRFDLRSSDTLHSFWVPALRLKQEAVPGRSIAGWFEGTRVGTYEIYCAELCGVAHTTMKGALHVDSPADFERWLAAARQG